jgi:membrane-associated protein
LGEIIDLFLHLDKHLAELIRDYGVWTYAILFAIIFAETGLVVTPFLPGDSLLFAAGIFAHPDRGALNPWILTVTLIVAAFIGDAVNYHIGKFLASRAVHTGRFLKKEHLDRTHAFFEKHGPKTIVLARFVPIVRTFAPFVAGMGAMTYGKFALYNIAGAVVWVSVCVWSGYFFGGMPLVRDNFSVVVLAVVAISVAPMIYELIQHKRQVKKLASAALEEGAQ